jgi:hypothetical protein
LAQEANEKPAPDSVNPGKQNEEASAVEEAPAEEKPTEALGYIPGQRRVGGLGLSPHSPRVPSLPGGTTIPFGAPDKTRGWQFNISGWASAALRVSSGSRDNATTDQHVTTLHTPPRTPDFYGAFGGTNAPPGSWVDIHFKYGNETVTAHTTLTAWKPERGGAWTESNSQNWVDQAYLDFALPPLGDLTLGFTVGAFRNPYGSLGQYGAGQYNTEIIGTPSGVGETTRAEYALSGSTRLHFEHGFMGRLGKAPVGAGPEPNNHGIEPSVPSSWVHHAHTGVSWGEEIPFVFGLHYLTNWSQDERDQIDSEKTAFIDEFERPDGRLTVYGADFRMINNYLGNFAIAAAYANAENAALLTGMSFFGAVSGEEMTRRYFGPRGGGTAKMVTLGAEYNISWSKFLYHPEAFWGEGPDLITSVFSNMGFIQSEDPDFDGRELIKFGSEVSYRFFSWAGISGRYDHVMPNSKDSEETFDVISPKIVLKSNWNSHEQVTISYTRWFYGSRTNAEFPYELRREQLDDQMFAINFGMWW